MKALIHALIALGHNRKHLEIWKDDQDMGAPNNLLRKRKFISKSERIGRISKSKNKGIARCTKAPRTL